MLTYRRLFFVTPFLLATFYSNCQWSVLDNDQRIALYKNERYLYQVFTKTQWDSSNFAKPEDIKWHTDARYGMFIHFGLNAYVNKDMSWPVVYNRKAPDQGHGEYPDSAWQKTWPSLFALEKFNADEWVKIALEAGMKYIIVIAKHHDGFHMWDTRYADFKITNTPFKRDYLKEITDACHKAKMPVGIYYSQRDWYHPDYAPVDTNTIRRIPDPPYYTALPGKKITPGASHKKYIAYQFNVIRELCTNYGKIDIFWFDAAWWGGMFTADMWQAEELTRMIRKLQPGILINNRTSLPGDFDTPEQRIGMYQQRPWESAMTLNGSWAYDPSPVKPVKALITQLLTAAAGNGNVLLSWGAHFNGEWDVVQKDTLLKIGKWLRQYGRVYYGTRGGPWMPTRNYGTVYNGNKVFMYVFEWKTEKLSLPALPGNKLLKAVFVNVNGSPEWRQDSTQVIFSRPAQPDSIVTIIELTMQHSVNGVISGTSQHIFDDPVYGQNILQYKPLSGDWKNKSCTIDLKQVRNITGIGIYHNQGPLTVSVSVDGLRWKIITTIVEPTKEIPLTRFMTGVEVPGRNIAFIRLTAGDIPAGSLKLDIYAK